MNRLSASAVAIVIIASASATRAQVRPDNRLTDEQALVQQVLVELYRAARAQDTNRYRSLCRNDYVEVRGNVSRTLEQTVRAMTSGVGDRTTIDQLDFSTTRIVGNTASVVFSVKSRSERATRSDELRTQASAHLVRAAGRWRVALLHSNTATEPAASTSPAWTRTLPVAPGDSLKGIIDDGKDKQVVTLFRMDETRDVSGRTFISGSGYVEIKGGGTYYSGPNRAQNPFIELTITDPTVPEFQRCRDLLTQDNLVQSAIRIGGQGYFVSRPGVKGRGLAVVRLDSIEQCELVPRR